MRPLFLTRLFLVSLACSLIVPCLRADEAGGDLQPIFPLPRSLFHNQYRFRNFDFDNGSAQVMSQDGKLLLTAGEDGLMVWDLRDRPEAKPRRFDAGMPVLFDVVAALSADGKTAAVVSMHDHGGDPTVRFFDTTTGKQTREIDNDEQISGLALAPDSRLLAVSTRQRIEWWNAEDGSEVRVSPAGQDVTYCLLTFSPDGKMLAALAQEANTIHIWETASGKERASLHFGGPSRPAPAGRRRRRVIRPPDEDSDSNSGILALALSADNRFLAASTQDSTIHLWDLQTGREAPP